MPGMNGIEVLHAIRKTHKDLPVVIVTAHGSIELAVEAIKAGADDFITKPFDPEHLALVVKKNLERAKLRSDVEFFAEELGGRHRLIAGNSEAMRQIVAEARKAAASKATVLLLGESGTGKELFARSIHNWSDRRLKPFVAINCAGLAKELLESELFGHEKGLSPGRTSSRRASWNWRTTARCFSTRSAISPWNCKQNSCASSKNGNLSGSAVTRPSPWTCASSPRRTTSLTRP